MFSILLYIFFYDIWFYGTHIILHYPTNYYVHKLHHSKSYDNLEYTDTNVGSTAEIIIQPLGIFIPCIFLHWSFFDFGIASIIISIRAMMRHDHRFTWLIGNHHLLHHKYPKYNFGEYWIDLLYGTKYPNNDEYIYGVLYT